MMVLPLSASCCEQRHDFRAGFGIEISRRLVREQDGRLVHQRAGDGDALALAAGKFVGLVMNAVGQADVAPALRARSAGVRRTGMPA